MTIAGLLCVLLGVVSPNSFAMTQEECQAKMDAAKTRCVANCEKRGGESCSETCDQQLAPMTMMCSKVGGMPASSGEAEGGGGGRRGKMTKEQCEASLGMVESMCLQQCQGQGGGDSCAGICRKQREKQAKECASGRLAGSGAESKDECLARVERNRKTCEQMMASHGMPKDMAASSCEQQTVSERRKCEGGAAAARRGKEGPIGTRPMKVTARYHEEESRDESAGPTIGVKSGESHHKAASDLKLSAAFEVPDLDYASETSYTIGLLPQQLMGTESKGRTKLPQPKLTSLEGAASFESSDKSHQVRQEGGEGPGVEYTLDSVTRRQGKSALSRADTFQLQIALGGERAMVGVMSNHFPVTTTENSTRSGGKGAPRKKSEPPKTDPNGGLVATPILQPASYVAMGLTGPGCKAEVRRKEYVWTGTVKCSETNGDGTRVTKDLKFELSF